MIGKLDGVHTSTVGGRISVWTDTLTYMTDIDAQAFNHSGGIFFSTSQFTNFFTCDQNPIRLNGAFCDALSHAAQADAIYVAASGNRNQALDFPAVDSNTIAVGAITNNGGRAAFSNFGNELDLAAPGVNIISTVFTNFNWNDECGDNIPDFPGCLGYGPCTGTSMAAPQVTGIVGLLRSANPLLNRDHIKSLLTSHASRAHDRNDQLGHGVPDAEASVKAALGVINGQNLTNRVTPLFSFYSFAAEDSFYTTVPQMATAAASGYMRPLPGNEPNPQSVSFNPTYGTATPGYSAFPFNKIYQAPPGRPPEQKFTC